MNPDDAAALIRQLLEHTRVPTLATAMRVVETLDQIIDDVTHTAEHSTPPPADGEQK